MRSEGETSLAARFFVAMMLVTGVAGGTAAIVGLVVAPRLFHDHLHRAMPSVSATVVDHADAAFWSANALGIVLALPAALLAAIGLSYYLSRRLRRSTRPLAVAAAKVAGGEYETRVQAKGLGSEFDELIDAFNQMAARLQRSEHSRQQLLADVTHELRTPVTTLNAYVEGLQDGIVVLDVQTGAVLKAQTARITRLTEDMAALSEAAEPALTLTLTRTPPEALLNAAVAAARDRYTRKRVGLRVMAEKSLPEVKVDPDRMGQVLGNLLDNALRHTPSDGSVTVSAHHVGDVVELTVEDSGEGIADEHLPLVFDRFYRVDSARSRIDGGGSGIGLAISKALVEDHGGRIQARSAGPGHGSTFVVSLPSEGGR